MGKVGGKVGNALASGNAPGVRASRVYGKVLPSRRRTVRLISCEKTEHIKIPTHPVEATNIIKTNTANINISSTGTNNRFFSNCIVN